MQLIFATRGPRIRGLGDVEGVLPRPDVLVTESRWDIYVPDNMRYGKPSTNMNLVRAGRAVSGDDLDAEFAPLGENRVATAMTGPLRITVPTSGIHFAFEKLYANQSDHETRVQIPYASRVGSRRWVSRRWVSSRWALSFVAFARRKRASIFST